MDRTLVLLAAVAPVIGCQAITYGGDPGKLAHVKLEQFVPSELCTGKGIATLSVRPGPGGAYRSIQAPAFYLRPGRYRFCYQTDRQFGTPGRCLYEMGAGFDSCGSEMTVEVSAGRAYLLRATTTGAELVAL